VCIWKVIILIKVTYFEIQSRRMIEPNLAVQPLVMLRIREIPSLYLRTESVYAVIFRGFPQSCQKNTLRLKNRPGPLPSASLLIRYFLDDQGFETR